MKKTTERFPVKVTNDPKLAELLPQQEPEPWDFEAVPPPKAAPKSKSRLDAVLDSAVRDAARRDPFLPWSPAEFKNMPRRAWRVGTKQCPIIIDKGLWAIFGLYKSAKTFFALEQGFCTAHGLDFLGQPTIQGNVVYLLAEGGIESAYERLQALCIKHDISEDEALGSGKFNLITSPVNFTAKDENVRNGVARLRSRLDLIEPAVVYLDTWMRMLNASGGHDSDPQTVGAALLATDMIRADYDCAAVIVAHVGHNEQWRMKGMIDLEGAIDGATFCEKKGEGSLAEFHFKSVFQRHAEDGYEVVGALKMFGKEAALVLKAASAVKLDALAADYRPAYEKLLELINLNTASDTLEGIPVGSWRDACKAADLWPDVANWRDKWATAKAAIVASGLISISSDTVYLAA
jgi:hypothetical protein